MLGTCDDHGFVGDGDTRIGSKDLTFLLLPCVDGKGEAGVDAGMEVSHVVIQIRLADLGVGVEDVHNKCAEIDGVKTFGGVIKNGVVNVVNCIPELDTCDGEDHLVGVPCLASSGVGGALFLTVGGHGAYWDDWVGQRFNMWDVECDVECLPVACQIDGWIL